MMLQLLPEYAPGTPARWNFLKKQFLNGCRSPIMYLEAWDMVYCDTAHITKVDYAYAADAWFPNLDEDPEWEITADSDEQTYFDLAYTFIKYERKRA